MVTFPNAKINIGLNITAKRADGYHDIETLFYPVGWKDILEIVPSDGTKTTLTVSGRKVDCDPEKNLVMKAYRVLNKYVGLPPCEMFLHKVIPDGAGLGGGSSDAAFTLRMLNEMFSLNFTPAKLASIAEEIGADCPFFIYNRPMIATGVGTDLKESDLNLSGKRIVIIKPPFSISTKEAYSGCRPQKSPRVLKELLTEDIADWQNLIKNDFENTLNQKYPEILRIINQLKAAGSIYSSLSGSGSAVYGIFDSDKLSVDLKEIFHDSEIYTGTLS